jgi:flagellar biosynthesis/type III secretory pathway M-ring protein FliF/YscJ
MEVLREFLARLSEAWNRLGKGQKSILALSAALAFTGLLVLAVWPAMAKPNDEDKKGFATLFRDLDPAEASQILEGLKAEKIEYKLENQGRNILVPRGIVDEQRIVYAAQGLPRSGTVGWEIFDKSQLGLTDFVQNINYRRALEGEIGRTIAGLGPVEAARVLISIPKPTLFTDREQPPTASVVVKLRAGGELDRKTTKGIAQLIASSVEGLKPQNVTILDQEGKVLNRGGGDDPSAQVEGNAEMRGQVEGLPAEQGLRHPRRHRGPGQPPRAGLGRGRLRPDREGPGDLRPRIQGGPFRADRGGGQGELPRRRQHDAREPHRQLRDQPQHRQDRQRPGQRAQARHGLGGRRTATGRSPAIR